MASTRLATFAPNEVTIVITQESTGFSHVLSGFADNQIVTIDRNSDTFSMYKGADDTPTRIYNSDTGLVVTVSLTQTSNSNDILSQLYLNDKATRDGLFSVLISDNSGRSRYFAEEAYIGVVPNAQYGSDMQTREWVIHAPRSDVFMGGNAKFTPEDASAMEKLGATVATQWLP